MQKQLLFSLVLILIIGIAPSAEARKQLYDVKFIRVVVLGDSFSSGQGIMKEDAYPDILQKQFNERFRKMHIDFINMSQSNYTSASAVRAIPAILAQKPHIAIIALGKDDQRYNVDPDIIRRSLEQIITLLTKNNIYTMLIGFKADSDQTMEYAMRYDAIFPELARKYHLSFEPDLLEPIKDNSILRQFESEYPDEEGMEAIAEHLYLVVYNMIRKIQHRVIERKK